jgi:hypothetical protein
MSENSVVHIVQNEDLFYVVDEQSKHIFEDTLGLPFYSFTVNQKDIVSSMLKRAKIRVKVSQARKLIKEQISQYLSEWVEHQPFKNKIKKKYEIDDEFTKITFVHLGPSAKNIAQKSAAIDKCQDSIYPYLIRVWEQLENHFYRVKMLNSQVETEPHKSGTIIRISFPLELNYQQDSEHSDE